MTDRRRPDVTERPTPRSHVRPARDPDTAAVRGLQRHLDHPSPDLLEVGLRGEAADGADVLVSTASESGTAGSWGSETIESEESGITESVGATTGVGDADPASSIAGYLLHVDGDDNRHVAEIVVDPAHRRSGRGRDLLEAAIAGSPGSLSVLVSVENAAARALYESCGLEAVERRPNEYGDRDGVLYRLER